MKKIAILTVILICLLVSCASYQPITKEESTYSVVVNVPNIPAKDLYVLINLWFVDTFRSADNVIQYSDKEYGVIAGKYGFAVSYSSPMVKTYLNVFATIKAEVRNGKYRITFSDPYCQDPKYGITNLDRQYIDQVRDKWQSMVNSSAEFINTYQSNW